MNAKKWALTLLCIALCLLISIPSVAEDTGPLDYLKAYGLTVDREVEGSVDVTFCIFLGSGDDAGIILHDGDTTYVFYNRSVGDDARYGTKNISFAFTGLCMKYDLNALLYCADGVQLAYADGVETFKRLSSIAPDYCPANFYPDKDAFITDLKSSVYEDKPGFTYDGMTPSSYLEDKGYTVQPMDLNRLGVGSGVFVGDFSNSSLCALAWSPEGKTHLLFWREPDGGVYCATSIGDALIGAITPSLGHLSMLRQFMDMCEAFSFDLALYYPGDGISLYFSAPVFSGDMLKLVNTIGYGNEYEYIAWEKYYNTLALLN